MNVEAEFFYADGGLVASNDPECIQSVFDTLMGIFDFMALR